MTPFLPHPNIISGLVTGTPLSAEPAPWEFLSHGRWPQLLWLCNSLQRTDPKRHRGIGGWLKQRPRQSSLPGNAFRFAGCASPSANSPVCCLSQWRLFREILKARVWPTYSLRELGNKVTYLPGFPHRTSPQSRLEMKQLLAETRQGNRSHLFPVLLGQDFRPILAIISS